MENRYNNISALIHLRKLTNKSKNLNIIRADLLDYKALEQATKNIDLVIHCAAVINGPKNDYYRVNVEGTKNLLKAAWRNKVASFIYISSWAANPEGSDYARSKYLAEQEVRLFPDYLIIRPADIYTQEKSHIHNFIRTIAKLPFIPVFGNGEYQISPVYMQDLVNTIKYLIKNKPVNKIITITGPKIYSYNKFIQLLKLTFNINKPVIRIPFLIAQPLITLGTLLKLPIPINLEQYLRLTTKKLIDNQFDFTNAGIKPLEFTDFLANWLSKN